MNIKIFYNWKNGKMESRNVQFLNYVPIYRKGGWDHGEFLLEIHIKLTYTANLKMVELEEICQMENHFLPNLSNMEIWGQQNAL